MQPWIGTGSNQHRASNHASAPGSRPRLGFGLGHNPLPDPPAIVPGFAGLAHMSRYPHTHASGSHPGGPHSSPPTSCSRLSNPFSNSGRDSDYSLLAPPIIREVGFNRQNPPNRSSQEPPSQNAPEPQPTSNQPNRRRTSRRSRDHPGGPPSTSSSSSSSSSSPSSSAGDPTPSGPPPPLNNHFPYPGNAPPPTPAFIPMVPTTPVAHHYHYYFPSPPRPPQPPLANWPQVPLWPTPAIPAVLLQPAGPTPVWEAGTFPVSRLGDPVPLRVHPHILYNPIDPALPVLQWDVVLRAEQARLLTGKGLISRPFLGDEAVIPMALRQTPPAGTGAGGTTAKIDNIWIESDTFILAWWMQYWGPIIIEKSTITAYLSIPLTNRDYRRAVQVQTQMEGVNHGNAMRLRAARRLRASNGCELRSVALKGRALEDGWSRRMMGADPGEPSIYRRSDVLGSYRRFMGLRPVVYSDGSWKLLLGLAPGPVPKFY
ncbi:hypothetical protein BT96DRAFT_914301 [Gymnopus androsaceus JB14]|uniref:Uncharacterized protein n=1 Tax=Gymnopus androsaceus JB14 TaxID=1447944 RepID=A0A6A4IFS5_9AGAR|nr:hypothetical protein BT96DRAFT_914301 [Gymnopus androsaceus JB14]